MDEDALVLLGELKAKLEALEQRLLELEGKTENAEEIQRWTRDDISNLFKELYDVRETAEAAVDIATDAAEEAAADPEAEPEAAADPEADPEPEDKEETFDASNVEKKDKGEKTKKKRKWAF